MPFLRAADSAFQSRVGSKNSGDEDVPAGPRRPQRVGGEFAETAAGSRKSQPIRVRQVRDLACDWNDDERAKQLRSARRSLSSVAATWFSFSHSRLKILEGSMTVAPHPADRTTRLDLPSTATRDLVLLVLLADTPIDAVRKEFGTYHDIFTSLFKHSIDLVATEKHVTQEPNAEYKLTVESYDVVSGDFPTEERIKSADGLLITGSAHTAHDDEPWIFELVDYIKRLPSVNPSLKTIGICFGQQVISRAYGTKSVRNDKGWEIGVHPIELTEVGRQVFTGRTQLAIHQMHRDNVPSLPEGFELLGSTDKCPVHGMVRYIDGTSSSEASFDKISIITLQGHPEFNSKIVNEVIEMRESKGVISKEVADESRENANSHDDGQYIGRVILRMFGL